MEPHGAKVTHHGVGGGSKRRVVKFAAVLLVIFSTNCTWALEEVGDWCTIGDAEAGICTPIDQCSTFLNQISFTHVVGPDTPGLCFYRDNIGAVACCPIEEKTTTVDYKKFWPSSRIKDNSPAPLSDYADYDTVAVSRVEDEPIQHLISEQKCQEYEAEMGGRDACGILPKSAVPFIVGGHEAEEGEYPHMAALGYLTSFTVRWECGGTLISHRYILTAAHCRNSERGEVIVASLGELIVRKIRWTSLLASMYSRYGNSGFHAVDRFISHPDYKPSSVYNDIALVRLLEPLQRFDELVRPACLYAQPEVIGFDQAEATGWGDTKQGGDDLEERPLMEVDLKLYGNGNCSNEYIAETRTTRLHSGIVDTMVCAGDPNGRKDTCNGDSGGPLQVKRADLGCLHRVLGVTSFGKLCGSRLALYTKVSSYLPWIESIVWPGGSNQGSPQNK